MTNEELLSVAEIVERATNRFNAQAAYHRERFDEHVKLIASMKADHEAKMVEHRAAFGARTEADAKIIAGLREESAKYKAESDHFYQRLSKSAAGLLTQVQDQRAEIERLRNDERKAYQDGEALRAEVADLRGIVDMVHASLGIKRGDHIGNAIAQLKAQTPKRSHPVAVGEYLRRLTGFSTTPAGEVAQVLHVDCDAPTTEYTVKRPNGQQGVWSESGCEPCDPPADHDTTAGKEAAESVIRDSQMTEIKVGNVVEVFKSSSTWTFLGDVGKSGTVSKIETDVTSERIVHLSEHPDDAFGLCDVRKVTT